MGYIYKITCKENDMVYIGKCKNIKKRWYNHLSDFRLKRQRSDKMNDDYDKYGITSFRYDVLEETANENKLIELEEKYIKEYKDINKSYNIRIGAKIDYNETSELERIENKNRTQRTEIYRKQTSDRMKMFAKDPEWRKRNSESKKGRVFSEDHKNKLSKAHMTENYKNKMSGANSPRAIKIVCEQNGKTYLTIKEAAKELNIFENSITKQLQGKYHFAGGYSFKKIGV